MKSRELLKNSKLTRGLGKEASTTTSTMLVVKLPPWWWPEHTEESSSAWQAELTPGHWEGPDPLRVPYTRPLPSGSSWACRMSYCDWELLDNLV